MSKEKKMQKLALKKKKKNKRKMCRKMTDF